jgi:hypothetical protein
LKAVELFAKLFASLRNACEQFDSIHARCGHVIGPIALPASQLTG